MFRKLCLLRHGDARSGQDDHARPLSPEGRAEAQRAAHFLQESGFVTAFALCSSARRAQETMEVILGADKGDFITRQLYLAAPDMILMQMAGMEPLHKSLLIVGHNPGISELALQLGATELFPTCGLAIFHSTAETWAEISPHNTQLESFFTP